MATGSRRLIVHYGSSSDDDDADVRIRNGVERDREDPVSEPSLLPPSPVGDPDPYVQENIRQCVEHQRKGFDFNASLKAHESFSNPYILETVVKVYNIDENGTNMPKDVFDPKRWQRHDFYQELARKRSAVEAAQQEAMRQRLTVQQQQAGPDGSSVPSQNPVAVDPQVQMKIRKQQQKIARYLAK